MPYRGIPYSVLDTRYLRLDAFNDPVTAGLEINATTAVEPVLILQTTDDNAANPTLEIQNAAGAMQAEIAANGSLTIGAGATPDFFVNTATGRAGVQNAAPGNTFNIFAPNTADVTVDAMFAASAATQTPLAIQTAAGQTANIQEWQTSTGWVMSAMGPTGNLGLFRPPVANIQFAPYMLGTVAADFAFGGYILARKLAAGAGSLYGCLMESHMNAAVGVQSLVYGFLNMVYHNLACTITDCIGGYNRINNVGAGTITNGYSLYIANAVNNGGGAITTNVALKMETQTTGVTDWQIYSDGGNSYHGGSFGIGSTAIPTLNNNFVLWTGDNTADPTPGNNTCCFYGKNVAGTVEAFAVDEAGNVAQLTSHNFTLFDPDPTDPYPFDIYYQNQFLGIERNVDLSGMVREVEKLTSKTFIHDRMMTKASWDDRQDEEKTLEDERRIQALMNEKFEVAVAESLELIDEYESVPTGELESALTGKFIIDENGKIVEEYEERPKMREVPTGEKVWVPQLGIEFDATLGKLYRLGRSREEAEAMYVPYEKKSPPPWMDERLTP